MIEVSESEAEAIRRFLGLSATWFRRRYLCRIDDGALGIRIEPQGHCVFLDTVAGKCSVYTVRPVQCRTYPFWPELVYDSRDWKREARRCEGIGRGEGVSVEKIEACLKQLESG